MHKNVEFAENVAFLPMSLFLFYKLGKIHREWRRRKRVETRENPCRCWGEEGRIEAFVEMGGWDGKAMAMASWSWEGGLGKGFEILHPCSLLSFSHQTGV